MHRGFENLILRAAAAIGIALLAGPPAALAALAASPCAGARPAVRVLARTGDVLESGAFDARGRFLVSDDTKNAVLSFDDLAGGGAPRALAALSAPGAMVVQRDGSVVVGYGDSAQNGLLGDHFPMSGLVNLDPESGALSPYAAGLGMANGLAQAPDGTFFATNDLGFGVDRIAGRQVTHGWASVASTNGAVVSPDGRYLYVSQTFLPAAVSRIEIAHPDRITTVAAGRGSDIAAGLDDMAMGPEGNLYVAANGAGQVWRVSLNGSICVVADGLTTPSAVTFGPGRRRRDLFVVGFDGKVSEIDGAALGARPGSPARSRRRISR